MRYVMMLVAVGALMAAMLVTTMATAWAEPPAGGDDGGPGGTGCEAGVTNGYFAIGTGWPSGDPSGEGYPAPYRENPGEGAGPDRGFDAAEAQILGAPHCPEQV